MPGGDGGGEGEDRGVTDIGRQGKHRRGQRHTVKHWRCEEHTVKTLQMSRTYS